MWQLRSRAAAGASRESTSNLELDCDQGSGEMGRWDATGGTLKINTSAVTSDVHQRKLYVNGSVGMNMDSANTLGSIGAAYLMAIDGAAAPELGRFKKILPSSLGFLSSAVTSINSQTGPSITLQTGTAGTDFAISQSSNTITFDLPSASAADGW